MFPNSDVMFVKNLKDTKTASDLENFHTVHLSIGTNWLWEPSELGTKCVTATKLTKSFEQA